MTIEIIALAVDAAVCILVPLIILGIIIKKNKEQWKGILAIFLCGASVYGAMQWGVKEHGLTWLFNNTDFADFMSMHYILYLLSVAFAGALLVTLAQMFIIGVVFKRKVSYPKTISFGLGYSMTAATLMMGVRSINTIVELIKGTEMELGTTVGELLLSGYERMLILIIDASIVTALVYFMEKKMSIRGALVATFCYGMVAFLPGFFLAFTLKDFYEVFDRSIALTMIYVILTATAVAGIVILRVLKDKIYSE